MLTKKQAERLLSYNPWTGEFRWRVDRLGGDGCVCVKAGSVAGWDMTHGYRSIGIGRKSYLAHRLAFLLMTGHWPKHQVDHIDMNRSNNRWNNLREATKAQNTWNRKEQKNNTSGMRGIHFYKRTGKFQTYIKINGCRINLGYFEKFSDAIAARLTAETKYFGEFRPT